MSSELIERIESGIPGLDRLVDGGIPRGNVIVAGRAGTGKSVLSVISILWLFAQRRKVTLHHIHSRQGKISTLHEELRPRS